MSPARKHGRGESERSARRSPADRGMVAERMFASPISRFQLAGLLGVHIDDLADANLARLPVHVLIDLAGQTDLHPADLVPDLEPLLALRRLPRADAEQPDPNTRHDAHVILAALTVTRGPLSPGALAEALDWTLERLHAALDLIAAEPDLPAPLTLHRTPRGGYFLAARADLINQEQRERLNTTADLDAFDFPPRFITLLAAAIAHGRTERYAAFKTEHLLAHNELTGLHLLLPVPGEPDQVDVHPDVIYSLTGYQTEDRIAQPPHLALAEHLRY